VPVLSSIVHTLQEKENRTMRSDFFLGIWDDYLPSVLMWPVPPLSTDIENCTTSDT
jgi:hypothetical protein